VGNGSLTLFVISSPTGVARIVTVGSDKTKSIWRCRRHVWCGQPVGFAWAPYGRRVAFTLTELGGNSPYVGFHILNVASGRDTQLASGAAGCFAAAELAWSPHGSRLAYSCAGLQLGGTIEGAQLDVLKLRGASYMTVPTGSDAFWPSWSSGGTRIAYSTQLTPTQTSGIYTVALDGSHRRLVASGGAAPAWSRDGRTIAYQTTCGIRLVTPSGSDVTPSATANACGAIGLSGPPVWSPDGTRIAVETDAGIYVMKRSGAALHLVSHQATTTEYGALPGRPSWRAIH
jgi:Tol biopolymer transport system component